LAATAFISLRISGLSGGRSRRTVFGSTPTSRQARRAVAFQFDENKCSVWCYGEEVDPASMAGILLPSNQHPFGRQDARLRHDHLFQLLL